MDVLVHTAVQNLTQAVERFDQSSAELVSTTNKLTRKILMLTYVVMGLSIVQVLIAVLR